MVDTSLPDWLPNAVNIFAQFGGINEAYFSDEEGELLYNPESLESFIKNYRELIYETK